MLATRFRVAERQNLASYSLVIEIIHLGSDQNQRACGKLTVGGFGWSSAYTVTIVASALQLFCDGAQASREAAQIWR